MFNSHQYINRQREYTSDQIILPSGQYGVTCRNQWFRHVTLDISSVSQLIDLVCYIVPSKFAVAVFRYERKDTIEFSIQCVWPEIVCGRLVMSIPVYPVLSKWLDQQLSPLILEKVTLDNLGMR